MPRLPSPSGSGPLPGARVPPLRGLGPLLALPLFLLFGSGCTSLETRSRNLRQLHDPDGSPRRVGNLQNSFEFAFAQVFEAMRMKPPTNMDKEEEIEDPLGTCLENLLDLAKLDSDDPRTAAVQVELFSWLAIQDTYSLSRERCFLELGELARHYGVERPVRLPEEATTAGAEEVADALARVVRATRLHTENPGLAGHGLGEEGDLQLAADRVRALTLDIDGARRALNAITLLIGKGGHGNPALAPLVQLQEDMAAHCIGLALGPGLRDPSPRVRAAALEANARALGRADDSLYQVGLRDPSVEVVHRLLLLLAENGLPEPSEDALPETPPGSELQPAEIYRMKWYRTLVELSASFEGRLSIAACRALGEVSPAGFRSIRSEDWTKWWEEQRDELALEPEVHGTR